MSLHQTSLVNENKSIWCEPQIMASQVNSISALNTGLENRSPLSQVSLQTEMKMNLKPTPYEITFWVGFLFGSTDLKVSGPIFVIIPLM